MEMLNFADLAHCEHQGNRGFCKKKFASLKNIQLPANDDTENPSLQQLRIGLLLSRSIRSRGG